MADKNNIKYTGLTNYANYHTFSKLQVGNNVNFGGSINRSGHTVTNTDAWLDDVPFYGTFATPSAALAAVGKSSVKNDLVKVSVGEGDIPAGLYRRNNVDNAAGDKTFAEIFTLYTIGTDKKDGASVLLNKNDKAVVRVWSSQELTLLDGANNSNADSEGQAARIIVNNAPVEQFIAIPDVARSGYPSAGYGIKVYEDSTGIAKEMTMDFDGLIANTFFDVPFAGVIMFGGGTVAGTTYTIDCFEYIGDKLAAVNTKIADIQETIENLTVEAGEGIKQIKTVEGSGITVATEGVEGATALTPVIDIDTDVIATTASVSALSQIVGEIQDKVQSGVVASITASSAAQTAGITVGGTTTAPEIQVTVGEVSDTSEAVVTGKAVAAALSEAQAAIKVTTDDHAARITKLESNEAGYATTTEVATAKSEAIAAAKTETESQVGAAKTEIKATTDDHETRIATIEGSYATSESVTTLGNTSLAAASTTEETYQVKVSTTGTVATGLSITVDTKDIASAAALSALDTKVTEHIELAAGTYLEVEVVDSLDSVTEPKTNKLYLVPNTGKGNNVKDEYIYTNGTWELIGTTEVDLTPYAKTADVNAALALKADQTALDSTNAEVAKKANSADVYTKTEIDTAQEATDAAITAADAKGQQGITDAATAKSAADAAQADATQALADAATAQGEVDELEGVVSTLSQVVTDNKTTTDAAIAAKADQTALDTTNTTVAGHTTTIETLNSTTIPAITDRLDAIEATPTVEVVAAESTEETPNYVTVSSATIDGKTTFTVASTGTLETRLDTLESFVGGSDTPGEGLSELLAKKVDNVTGGSNGITIATADTADGRVATLSVTPDTTVTKDSTNVVTSGAVETAISASASTTLDSAKAYAEEQVEALTTELNAGEVSAENTAVSVTQTNGKITAVTVTKGEIADKNTNLVDGGTVYAVTSALQTAVDKKLDSSTYTADKEAIEGRLDTAEGEIDALQEFVNGANDAYAAKSIESIATSAVQTVSTESSVASAKLPPDGTDYTKEILTVNQEGTHVQVSLTATTSFTDGLSSENAGCSDDIVPTAFVVRDAIRTLTVGNVVGDDNLVSVETSISESGQYESGILQPKTLKVSLAENVATTDIVEGETTTVTGTVYTKAQTDSAISAAVGTAVQSVALAEGNTQTTISVATSDANAVTFTVADNIATVDKVTVGEDGTITVDTEGDVYSKETIDKMVSEAAPENYIASISGYNAAAEEVTTTQGAAIKVLDGRGENVYPNDLWGTKATFDGTTLTVDHTWVTNPNAASGRPWLSDVTKVENNKAYNGDTVLANIQTEMIKDGLLMFFSTPLTSFSGDLSSLVDGDTMFHYCTSLESFNSDLSSLTKGEYMFSYCTSLASFSGDLSGLAYGNYMFSSTALTSFNSDLSNLLYGLGMFYNCSSLASFSGDLSSLAYGNYMFYNTSLASFSSDLSNLYNGESMFNYCTSLESFSSDLSSLADGSYMFYNTSLTSFSGDLNNLTNGEKMFDSCTSLTSFNGDLSSLADGSGMFSVCSLDSDSVMYIADSIKDWGVRDSEGNLTGTSDDKKHYITIDVGFPTFTSDAEVAEYLTEIANKGWTVATNHTAFASASAADGTQNAVFVIARPVEDEKRATHTTTDGKFVAVESAVSVIGIHQNQWTIFPTVEDAIAEWELTPIVK